MQNVLVEKDGKPKYKENSNNMSQSVYRLPTIKAKTKGKEKKKKRNIRIYRAIIQF